MSKNDYKNNSVLPQFISNDWKIMQEEVVHMSGNRDDMIYGLEQYESIPVYWMLYK